MHGFLGGLLGADEHCRETLICDFGAEQFEAIKYQRTLYRSGDQRALWKTPWHPLGGLLGAQEHRRETLTCDVGVVKSAAVK